HLFLCLHSTAIFPLSLHDALPIYSSSPIRSGRSRLMRRPMSHADAVVTASVSDPASISNTVSPSGVGPRSTTVKQMPLQAIDPRSEEHTSELQSRENLVCRLLLEK